MDSLSEKLKSLGVKVGVESIPRPEPKPAFDLARVIPGRVQETLYGETYRIDSLYPPDYRHGNVSLSVTASLRMMTEWGRANHLADGDCTNFFFLDTETTGLSGGTGTYAFLVGIGRYHENGFELVQFIMRDPTEEPALLAALNEFLSSCRALVTYNGKAFDAPLLNTRFLMQGLTSPLGALPHLDLLPLARRLWRDRLPSRSLGYIEAAILGAYRTQEEVPGFLIPQIYFDYLRSGDARPLQGVIYHNAKDVLALAALFSHTVQLLANPLELEIEESLDIVSIARLFEDLGYQDSAIQLYHLGLEKGLPEEFFWETIQRLALLHRRRLEWPKALELWKKAASYGKIEAHVELAKYCEHTSRDYPEALAWTQAAIETVMEPRFPLYLRKQLLPDLEHRRLRLLKRLDPKIR
ncbi:MAG TPA: ribonuclease H-like domain-containing protein [Anaerolineaceae bacterium]|nr:ribonuclease H-like domain-containing protein [Anaerolineaceae bacterium]